MRIFICCLISGLGAAIAFGQTPDAQFLLQPSGCLGENIVVQNQSSQALTYEWDICQGDLGLMPAGAIAGTISGSNIPTGVDVVYDGATWYAFVTDRNNHAIRRISLGPDATSFGSNVNLGNISSLLSSPTDINIVSDNGQWYGFVFNEGANIICRLDFGNSLTNAPSATIVLAGAPGSNQGLDVVRNGTQWYIVYTFNSQVGVLRLSTIETIPVPDAGDQRLTTLSGSPSLGDIKVLNQQGSFYAYTTSLSSPGLYKLAFGTDLFSIPAETNISAALPSPPPSLNYYGLDGGNDAGKFYLVCSTLQGPLVRIDLGDDLAQSPIAGLVLGNLGTFFNTVKNKMIKHQTSWHNFSVDYVNGTLFRASFPTPSCQMAPGLLTEEDLQLEFTSDGAKFISLRSFNGGAWDEEHQSITISTLTAPGIDFTSQQMCVQNPIQFTYTSDQSIASQNWDFGDGQTATSVAPENTFVAAGPYSVKIVITSLNGCSNNLSKIVNVYNQPSADFTLPTGLICTNNEFTFVNETPDDFDGNLTYQWSVNSVPVNTVRDLQHAFTSTGDQDIKLVAAIPGCLDELTQSILNVQGGPAVGFSASGNCEGETITFTNTSAGDIAGYEWDFGNGQSSTDTNPTQAYPDPGTYVVSLQTNGTNGCVSTSTIDFPVYSTPQPDFSLDLPPFSCSGTPSQFHDLTPPPSDSNLQSWDWSLGDNTHTFVKDPTHIYTVAGNYFVDLTVTTDKGCGNVIHKQILIAPSPTADFTFDPACVNQASRFTDASGTTIKSWLWKINNSTYFSQSPEHIFLTPGTYNAQLTATENNNCVGVVNKTVVVPVVPAMDFMRQNPCAAQEVVFTDQTLSSNDPVIKWDWEFAGPGAVASGPTAKHTFSVAGTFPVKLSVESQAGCKYALTKNVTIYNVPQAGFEVSEESGPPPLTVQFTNTTAGPASYSWRFNDELNTIKTEVSPDFTFNTLGEYIVDLVATNDKGCSALYSRTISIIIPHTELALEEFTLAPDPATGKVRSLLRIRNNSNYRIHAFDVVLDLGSQVLLTERINLSIAAGGVDSFVLANELVRLPTAPGYICANLDISDDERIDNNKKCISFGEEHVLFHPFPNPSQGLVTVQLITSSDEVVKIRVVSAVGAKVYDKVLQGFKGLNAWTLDLTNLNPGIYLLLVETASQSMIYRIMIE